MFNLTILLSGFVQSQDVTQFPPDLIGNLTDAPVLHCSHSIQGFEHILWYKHDGRRFNFFGYINLNYLYPEEEVKNKVTFAGDGRNNVTFTINSLTSDDNGVYYCAARRHSVSDPHKTAQKQIVSLS